eukprot:GHVS01085696.1.p1 GENE.GHVS01085696.1~~GHVS01085696.1.p1  ORF type:complete len:297 (-),score=53.87 GHVS01085696.1:444-1334(-)
MELPVEDLRRKFQVLSHDLGAVEGKLSAELGELYGQELEPRKLLQDLLRLDVCVQNTKATLDDILCAKMLLTEQLQKQFGCYNAISQVLRRAGLTESDESVAAATKVEDVLRRWRTATAGNNNSGIDQENSGVGSLQFHSQLVQIHNQQSSGTNMSLLPAEQNENQQLQSQDEHFPGGGATTQTDDNIISSKRTDGFTPICEAEFTAVPLLVRRRALLPAVNKVYSFLWMRAIKHGGPHNISKMEFAKHNLSVVGQTGEAKLATLRHLKLLEINRDGSVRLVKDCRLTASRRQQQM